MKENHAQELTRRTLERAGELSGEATVLADAELFGTLLRETDFSFPEVRPFVAKSDFDGIMGKVTEERKTWVLDEQDADGVLPRTRAGYDLRAYTGDYDFSHTAPDWKNLLRLGLPGVLSRLASASEREGLTDAQTNYYRAGISVWSEVMGYTQRMAKAAQSAKKAEMAEGLLALTRRAPATLSEAMRLISLYFQLQQWLECTPVRTLGRIDEYLNPYYENDLRAGVLTPDGAAELTDAFLREMNDQKAIANVPMALGGAGEGRVNGFSYLLLRRFLALALPDIKMHILYCPELPADFVRIAMEGIRKGSNSIVFMNDRVIRTNLEEMGIAPGDAAEYTVVGCYETCGAGEVACSCNGRVNLAMAAEAAMTGGRDLLTGTLIGAPTPEFPKTRDDYLDAFLTQVNFFCDAAAETTDAKEKYDPRVHSAPFFSALYDSCVERGGDVYCDFAAKYNNSSINLVGLATAVDAVTAACRLVFEEKILTMRQLAEVLKNNWAGQEALRHRVLKTYPKYGIGDAECDALAARILASASGRINGRPNVKGGVYRLGAFSIDWRFSLGKRVGATPDGRLARESVSKNLCASLGADREGNTALVLSACALDPRLMPNGAVLDLVFHSSAVSGENGLRAMEATLKTYFSGGGIAIQYNVLDADVLRRAQVHPEEYPNLQVRLCGWNVLFSDLSRTEQDEFIRQSEVGA